MPAPFVACETKVVGSKAIGGGLVSPVMAGPVFDDLSVKGRHSLLGMSNKHFTLCIAGCMERLFLAYSSAYPPPAPIPYGQALTWPFGHNIYHHKLMAGPD